MTTSKSPKKDIHNAEEATPETSHGSNLSSKFIAYYSTASDNFVAAATDVSSPQGLFAPATPASSASTESTAASVPPQMRRGKLNDSSGQSTDSEAPGNSRSSESSSSMGDSAAAAARVLAALQDRSGVSSSSAAAGSVSAIVDEGPGLWRPVKTPAAKIQSSTSTPRQNYSSFDANAREGSAPLPGSFESSAQRRPDMGFLALLNSAAAYVAESSSSAAMHPAVISRQNNTHSYNGHINHDGNNGGSSSHSNRSRQQNVDNSAYLAHSDLLSANPLTLSGINNGFGHVAGGSSDGQSGFPAHYDSSLSNAAYRDLAQALQNIAATTSDNNSALLSSSAVEAQSHQLSQLGQQSFDSSAEQISRLTASVIHQDHIIQQNGQYSALPRHEDPMSRAAKFGSATTPQGPTSASKRKRKNGSSDDAPFQTPAKRKNSQALDQSKLATLSEARRAARKWTEEETDNLLKGCSKYGVGAWKKILDDPNFTFNSRTSVDLKDRFRTIRAQECAHSPHKKSSSKNHGKEPDVVWPLPPDSQRLQGLQRVQRKPTRNYTNDEDRRLLIGVMRHANHWTKIAADPDLKLANRPGQSLRDRLRNAFPEVFELFGYVIPNKERADRERHTTPGPHPAISKSSTPKRKAPTGSKRLDGDIPDHIRDKILAVLRQRNDSLDPHPIPENDVDPRYDADADANDRASHDGSVEPEGDDLGLSAMSTASVTPAPSKPRTTKRRSTASESAHASSTGDASKGKNRRATASLSETADDTDSKSKKAGGRRKSTAQKRGRSRSKAADSAYIDQAASGLAPGRDPVLGSVGPEYEVDAGYAPAVPQNEGGIHSAPAHGTNGSGVNISDFSALSDSEQRRPGTISAGSFGAQNHRNFLLESFAPSVFSRPVGTAMPTDHLDALALEGRGASGYSTPTQSTKRRHSVQADFNDAMAAAAAMAAGIDRSNFSSTMGYFNASVAGMGHSSAGVSSSTDMHLDSTADTIRRMTVGGHINPDAFLFPRLPDEDVAAAAAAAAAAAVAADMSAQISTSQSSSNMAGVIVPSAQNTAGAMTTGEHNGISVSTDLGFKLQTTSAAAEPSLSASATMNSAMGDIRDDLLMGHRSQLRSAQRLLRENGVADDNSIGLSTTSNGDTPVDLEALANFSQWFPSFASSNLGWNLNDSSSGHIGGDSIDPNMLNAGIGTSATIVASANGGHVVDESSGISEVGNGMATGSGMTHSRRRSQFDWYGLTPSLAATLDAANITVAAAAQAVAVAAAATTTSDANSIASLHPFGIGHHTTNPSYRRPSMPVYPSFAYAPGSGDILGLQPNALHNNSSNAGAAGAMDVDQGTVYNSVSQDSGAAGIAEAAAAAAAVVAVALGDGSEPSGQRASTANTRSLSLSTGSETVRKSGVMPAETIAVGGSAHSRRRTMDVPPSLMEDVATSSFGNSLLNGVPAIPQSNESSGSIIRALNLQTQSYQQLTGERNGTSGYPPRPGSGTLKPVDSRATRVRRSQTISNQNRGRPGAMVGVGGRQQQRIGGAGSSTMQTLPAVSEATTAQLMQFPHVSEARGDCQQATPQQNQQHTAASVFGSLGIDSSGLGASETNSGTQRHGRTLSGPQLTQEAMNALADASPGLLAGFRLHDEPLDFGLAGHTATPQQYQQPKASGASSSQKDSDDSMNVDLEAMTTLSAGCVGSMDFSSTFKPYLWTATGLGEDALNGAATAVEETQSLVDLRRGDADGTIDLLYRPASSTPTGGRRFQGIGGSNAASESTPTSSPVAAPRSAASTPGRREVVEI